MRTNRWCGAVVLTALLGCSSKPASAPRDAAAVAPATKASIGSATMEADGTLVLTLRAEGPGGIVGDSQFRYPKDHPQYGEVLRHLGGLKPGESKPVPPWPE